MKLLRLLLPILGLLSLSAQASSEPGELTPARLPGDARPLAYRLDLTVDPSRADFSGKVEIDLALSRAQGRTLLNGNGLKVTAVTARTNRRTIAGTYRQLNPAGLALIEWASPLPAGKATISLSYSAAFRSSAEGLFHAELGGSWYAWTQFQPIDARRVFPSFDEPGFKAPFTVSLTVPAGMKAFANAPETSTRPVAGSTLVLHRFATSQPLPTELVSVAVGAFDVGQTTVPPNAARPTPLAFRVIAPRGSRASMAFALAEAPKLLALTETYLDRPYPFEKLDFVASPLMGGGMENPGLVLFNDSAILLGDKPDQAAREEFGSLVAHELAHQWFGDAVTPVWWTDLWLNESFASWMSTKIAQRWDPSHDYAEGRIKGAFAAMDVDSLPGARPVRQPVTNDSGIASIFDSITYQKGEQVLTMFEAYLGDDVFRQAVRSYLSKFGRANASAEDFFNAITAASKKPAVVTAMRQFVDQPGVPLISIEQTSNRLVLSQTAFRPLGTPAADGSHWTVPFCFRQGTQSRCVLVGTKPTTVRIGGDAAVVPNPDAAGYYRYAFKNGWSRLVATAPGMRRRDALAFADSLWASFTAGRASVAELLDGARSLAANQDGIVGTAMADRLAGLASRMLSADELPGYSASVRRIYGPRLTALGSDIAAGQYPDDTAEQRADRLSLVQLLALEGRDPVVRRDLARRIAAYLSGDRKALDPAYASLAARVAVQDGGQGAVDRMKALLAPDSSPQLRGLAARALSAAPDTAADDVLALASSGILRGTEIYIVLRGFMDRPETRDRAADFIDRHLDVALTSLPNVARPMLIDLFGNYCDTSEINRPSAVFGARLAALGATQGSLRKAEESIRVCAAIKAAHAAQFAAAFAGSSIK